MGLLGNVARKSQVAAQHSKLAENAGANCLTQYWTERLGALGEVLRTR